MDLDTVNNYILTVQLIKCDISNNLNKSEIVEKWKAFSIQNPKLFDSIFSDPKCLERLETMKKLFSEVKSNDINNYEASVKFGKYISKDYLPPKTNFN
tara:strand:- start:1221 stop:1514 length:294 start_codon:yes stop_codon:yes gene_type:complete